MSELGMRVTASFSSGSAFEKASGPDTKMKYCLWLCVAMTPSSASYFLKVRTAWEAARVFVRFIQGMIIDLTRRCRSELSNK